MLSNFSLSLKPYHKYRHAYYVTLRTYESSLYSMKVSDWTNVQSSWKTNVTGHFCVLKENLCPSLAFTFDIDVATGVQKVWIINVSSPCQCLWLKLKIKKKNCFQTEIWCFVFQHVKGQKKGSFENIVLNLND